jgi:hypothetical protein
MTEIKKRVDESWKERVEHEKQEPPVAQQPAAPASPSPIQPPSSPQQAQAAPQPQPLGGAPEDEGLPEARFDLFVSGLAMDALIALGDVPHPVTKKHMPNLEHARYLIDVLGVLEEKTKNNLTVDEARLMKDALYQLRMRYMAKAGGGPAVA